MGPDWRGPDKEGPDKCGSRLLAYFDMVTVPHKMVGLERMLDYRGVGLSSSF